jgi:hypothetical protein
MAVGLVTDLDYRNPGRAGPRAVKANVRTEKTSLRLHVRLSFLRC